MAKVGGNKAPTLFVQEKKDYEKIMNNENGFPWTLVHDRDEVEKYWSNAVLPIVDPPVAAPIGPGFQIGEPSWADFTFDETFYALNTLFF